MKKSVLFNIILFIIVPVLAVGGAFAPFAFAKDGTSYDWYFKATEDGSRPAVCPEAAFLKNYQNVITLGPDKKEIYLTFDAGFDNGNMGKILDTLKEKKVKAAFFVDGNFVKNEPELVKRISEEGHILGNHTLSHADMSTLADFDKYKEQVVKWNDLAIEAGGKPSGFFRFPCGKFSERALEYNERLGLQTVFWSFAYYDWDQAKQPSPSAALTKILSRTHNGCVMLLHSVSSTNAEILPTLIDRLQMEGYKFKALSEM